MTQSVNFDLMEDPPNPTRSMEAEMTDLTMLTEMMSPDLEEAIRLLKEINITCLDLKGGILGRKIEDLEKKDGETLAEILSRTGTRVYCFSSVLGHQNVSVVSETDFRGHLEKGVSRLIETISCVRPTFVRLLACWFSERSRWLDANEYMEKNAPWVYSAYRDAALRILETGVRVSIENEPGCMLSFPAETVGFFDRLDLSEKARFTWDIQNMWQSGTYPDLEVYRTLCPVTGYVHLKGGRGEAGNPRVMVYRSLLKDASWPVTEIVGEVLKDGISPVLCLNCSHGPASEDYPFPDVVGTPLQARREARHDVRFLREFFPGQIR